MTEPVDQSHPYFGTESEPEAAPPAEPGAQQEAPAGPTAEAAQPPAEPEQAQQPPPPDWLTEVRNGAGSALSHVAANAIEELYNLVHRG